MSESPGASSTGLACQVLLAVLTASCTFSIIPRIDLVVVCQTLACRKVTADRNAQCWGCLGLSAGCVWLNCVGAGPLMASCWWYFFASCVRFDSGDIGLLKDHADCCILFVFRSILIHPWKDLGTVSALLRSLLFLSPFSLRVANMPISRYVGRASSA